MCFLWGITWRNIWSRFSLALKQQFFNFKDNSSIFYAIRIVLRVGACHKYICHKLTSVSCFFFTEIKLQSTEVRAFSIDCTNHHKKAGKMSGSDVITYKAHVSTQIAQYSFIQSDRTTLHQNVRPMSSYSETNKMLLLLKLFILAKHSTCFGRSFRPSSGVQDCTYSNRLCQTETGWNQFHLVPASSR
jgi:hypothetical protein